MEETGLTEFLGDKIKLLDKQRHKLHATVDSHIQRVLSISQAWMEGNKGDGNGKTLTVRDISLLIDDATLLMVDKCQGFRGDGEVSTVSPAPESASVPSLVTVPNLQSPDVSKSALSRIQDLEEAVSSLSTSMSKLSETQSEINACTDNLTAKQSQMDEEHQKSSKEIEECQKQLTHKQTKNAMEQNQRLEDLEHRFEVLENAQSQMDEKVCHGFEMKTVEPGLKTLREDVERQRKDFTDLKDNMEEMILKKIEDVAKTVSKKEKINKRFQKVEQRIEMVEEREAENVGRLEDFERKLDKELGGVGKRLGLDKKFGNFDKKLGAVEKKFDKELEAVGKRLEAVDEEYAVVDGKLENVTLKLENLEAVEKQRKEGLAAVKKKTDQLESSHTTLSSAVENQRLSLQELTTTIESHSSTLETLKSNRETDAANLQKILNKVRLLKREKNRALEKVGKQFDDVGVKYQMVCQIVADRLVPLERLREILNKKAKYSEENVEKLHKVVKDVAALEPKVSQLESQITKPAVYFAAYFQSLTGRPIMRNGILHDGIEVCISGCSFDSTSGVFTALQDGLYGVGVRGRQKGRGSIRLDVMKALSGSSPDLHNDEAILGAETYGDGYNDWNLTLVDMKENDQLYVAVNGFERNPILSTCNFAVFLVK